MTPRPSRPLPPQGADQHGSADGNASCARPAPRWQSTRSPASKRSGSRDRASPRGPPSWRKCGARRSSSARPAMTASTRTPSRTRHKSLESPVRGKPARRVRREAARKRPGFTQREHGTSLGSPPYTTCRRTRPPPSAAGQSGRTSSCASRPRTHRGLIRSRRNSVPSRTFVMANSDYRQSPRAGPQAAGLPALAQRPRPSPRRAGRPAPRASPHPQRTPATLGPTETQSRMTGPVDVMASALACRAGAARADLRWRASASRAGTAGRARLSRKPACCGRR